MHVIYCAIIHFKLSAFVCNALGAVYWKIFAKSLQISHFLLCRKSVAMPHYKNIFVKHFKLAFSQKFSNATLLMQ